MSPGCHNTRGFLVCSCCSAGQDSLNTGVPWGRNLLIPHDLWILVCPSAFFYLHMGHVKEGSLENRCSGVNTWLTLNIGCCGLTCPGTGGPATPWLFTWLSWGLISSSIDLGQKKEKEEKGPGWQKAKCRLNIFIFILISCFRMVDTSAKKRDRNPNFSLVIGS